MQLLQITTGIQDSTLEAVVVEAGLDVNRMLSEQMGSSGERIPYKRRKWTKLWGEGIIIKR